MATKVGKLAKGGRKGKAAVVFTPFLKTTIPAGQAKPAPPLGPQLGQVKLLRFHEPTSIKVCTHLLSSSHMITARSYKLHV